MIFQFLNTVFSAVETAAGASLVPEQREPVAFASIEGVRVMSKRIRVALGVAVLLGGTTGWAWSASPSAATLTTFEDVDGQRYFALSVQPTAPLPAAGSRDVLILVDTSASQTGAYRSDSLEALQTVLHGLRPEDRVQLAAVDLQMVPLSEGFAAAASPSTQIALAAAAAAGPVGFDRSGPRTGCGGRGV